MRIGSFAVGGKESYGVCTDGGIVDLGPRLGARYRDLLALIQQGGLSQAKDAVRGARPDLGLDDIVYLPLMTRPTNVYCAGRNYYDHVAEMREGAMPPEFPRMFIKTMGALVGHDAAVVKPKASDCFDYEAELAVVIGKDGRHIKKENALDHVAGYTCLMDGSIRDWQQRTTDLGKNFWRSSSIGPWMATPDDVPSDRTQWKIQGRLNGQVMQSSTIALLIHGIEDLIENYSTMTELKAGDVIATGTCSGVGHARKPPVYLKPGDVFEIEIDGIGVLRNPVIAE